MCKYIISSAAISDLREIWLYTYKTWSSEQADRYYNLLMDEIETLTKSHIQGKDYQHIRKGYKYVRVKSHMIFYRETEDEQIEIIRILHGKMDVDSIIEEN